jgi:membrane associated rhomboid family serine protease
MSILLDWRWVYRGCAHSGTDVPMEAGETAGLRGVMTHPLTLPSVLLVALLTLGLYGGIVWGVLPTRAYISWEGHLFGLLAGVLVARLVTPQDRDTSVSSPTAR